jgi:hypothetical protein
MPAFVSIEPEHLSIVHCFGSCQTSKEEGCVTRTQVMIVSFVRLCLNIYSVVSPNLLRVRYGMYNDG